MRKIKLSVAISLDGLIEGPNGEYDWCFTDQDYGMSEFLRDIDAIFYGRKSYQMMNAADMPGGNPWKDKKSYVFSNTLTQVENSDEIISGNIIQKVQALKNGPGKDIWLFGGAVLTTSLINAGLVDELMLAIHPIILGAGKPLFVDIKGRIKTTLISSTPYSTGLVMLHYKIN
jgi:dihydrofolate reductase